jgi:myo-inositol-1(or 4)-monophosphatase
MGRDPPLGETLLCPMICEPQIIPDLDNHCRQQGARLGNPMDSNPPPYAQVREFVLTSGRRIRSRAGKLEDIGVAKSYLTEEDLRIESELSDLLQALAPSHSLYAEEKHDFDIGKVDDLWVCDPISGTHTFLAGLAHFGIVVAHVHRGEPVFALVFDPSTDELFEARLGQGATCNGVPIHVNDQLPFAVEGPRITFNLTYNYRDPEEAASIFRLLTEKPGEFDLYRNTNSFGVNICHVACGRYDGVVALTKDSFPEVAGSLILREAGGVFETFEGFLHIAPADRRFLGGSRRGDAALREKLR